MKIPSLTDFEKIPATQCWVGGFGVRCVYTVLDRYLLDGLVDTGDAEVRVMDGGVVLHAIPVPQGPDGNIRFEDYAAAWEHGCAVAEALNTPGPERERMRMKLGLVA